MSADVYNEDGYYAVIPEWVLDAAITAQAVRLYAVLRRYADQRTMHAHPSRKTLAERLQVKDEKVVDRALADLQRIGAVTVFPRWRNEAGEVVYAADEEHRERTSNGYRINRIPVVQAEGGGGGPSAPTPRRQRPHRGGASAPTPGAQKGEEPQPVDPQPVEPQGGLVEEVGDSSARASEETPSPTQPDGVLRTCPGHRLTPATGPCPPCGDWRRAVEATELLRTAEAVQRSAEAAAAERKATRRARDLADAEVDRCGLCDAAGTATVSVPAPTDADPLRVVTDDAARCLHDAGANERALQARLSSRFVPTRLRPQPEPATAS